MSDRLTAAQIEDQVKLLDPEQLKLFADRFEEYKSDLWDDQIEADINCWTAGPPDGRGGQGACGRALHSPR